MKLTVFRSIKPTAEELQKYGEAARFTNPPDIAWSIRSRMRDLGYKFTGRITDYREVLALRFEAT